MVKKIIFFSIAFSVLAGFLIMSQPILAQNPVSIIETTNPKYALGNYDANDILAIVINTSKLILGVVGSLTLLMFIYGGFSFLISAGSSEKVAKAKGILTAAVIGLIIVFSSFLLIKFFLGALGRDDFDGNIMKIGSSSATGTKYTS